MAKAGSGDVLTGMILALLAQKYSVDAACRVAMYLHGFAGDLARNDLGEAGILASDLVFRIGKAFGAILHT
jgi:NAD(P)H-hydrate epimerase